MLKIFKFSESYGVTFEDTLYLSPHGHWEFIPNTPGFTTCRKNLTDLLDLLKKTGLPKAFPASRAGTLWRKFWKGYNSTREPYELWPYEENPRFGLLMNLRIA